ncbi:MAG: COX15/CtaA family protein [Acetobacteraceae bacterium]
MPFDVRDFAGALPGGRAAGSRSRALVAAWLFGICGMILVMIVLGGATRLTGSGLSIMEWEPLRGALPPLNHAEWEDVFRLYQQTPQYRLLHQGMDLDGFRQIFWLEWVHRQWGRLIGIAFFVPLLWFWITGRIGRQLRVALPIIFLLGGLQGAIGWFMVESGLRPESIAVAPLRLTIHLCMALILYAAVLWTGLGLLRPQPEQYNGGGPVRAAAIVLCALVAVTIVAGSLVAGTYAGFVYNTFPLMEGRLIPANYDRLSPFVRNLTQNLAAVQFDHRVLATLTGVTAAIMLVLGLVCRIPRSARVSVFAAAALVAVQYALGVATLLLVVPVPLGVAHQFTGVLVLSAAIVALHTLRRDRQLAYPRWRVPA